MSRTGCALSPAEVMDGKLPRHIDPFDAIHVRGELVIADNEVCERIGGHLFARALLDTVRAAFHGVRWSVGYPDDLRGAADGRDAAIAYGCLDGRCVGAVCEGLASG